MRLAKAPANRTGAFASRFSPAPGYAAAARRAAAWPGGAEPGPRPFPPSFRLPGPIGRGAWLSAAFWRWWNLQPPGGGRRQGAKRPKRLEQAACGRLLQPFVWQARGPAGPPGRQTPPPPRRPGRSHAFGECPLFSPLPLCYNTFGNAPKKEDAYGQMETRGGQTRPYAS